MARGNGKPEVEPVLDAGRELPASDDVSEPERQARASGVAEPVARDAEMQKLKAERDTLLDRLARLQAEFENARKRAAKEQQDFREFAAADVIKSILPVLDSFDRALQTGADKS